MKKSILLSITILSLSGSTALLCSQKNSFRKFIKDQANSHRYCNHTGATQLTQSKFDTESLAAQRLNNYSPKGVASNSSSPTNLSSPARYIPGLKPKQLTEQELVTILASLTIK